MVVSAFFCANLAARFLALSFCISLPTYVPARAFCVSCLALPCPGVLWLDLGDTLALRRLRFFLLFRVDRFCLFLQDWVTP